MKQFTSEKGNFDQEDIRLMKRLFPEIKKYDERAFSDDIFDIMPIPLLIRTSGKTNSAFAYGNEDVHYLNREVA